jgi:hypothetical protein
MSMSGQLGDRGRATGDGSKISGADTGTWDCSTSSGLGPRAAYDAVVEPLMVV